MSADRTRRSPHRSTTVSSSTTAPRPRPPGRPTRGLPSWTWRPGSAEFGEQWHRQGNLTHKQNVFDDFAAAIGHLVARRYTSRRRLAIEGGSNGGLLMGATLVQHPELVKAVVSHVGIYDMLRVELTPNGAFNVTEFGTVKDPAQFRALLAYSPYHHVTPKTAYPAVFFLTGARDPRVEPWHSRKMAARLQAATSASPTEAPILLRTASDAGHGGDTSLSERINQLAAVQAFLLHQLGVPVAAAPAAPAAPAARAPRAARPAAAH